MAQRTARGTASEKASGATLTIPSFTVPAGHSLVVGVGCDNAEGAPSTVVHAGRTLRRKLQRDDVPNGIHGSVWIKGEYNSRQTGSCVLTWAGAIGKRAAAASSYDRVQKEDDDTSDLSTASTSPGTRQTGSVITAGSFVTDDWYEIVDTGTTDFTLIGAEDSDPGTLFLATGPGAGTGTARSGLDSGAAVASCFFVAEGPLNDLPGSVTAQIENDATFEAATIGQSDGTNGAPPPSNIYVIETFLELTARNPTRGRLQNATSRNWIGMLLALEPRATFLRQGITPSDVFAVEQIVTDAAGETNDIYYGFNEDTGEWQAYETTTPGTLRAKRDINTGDWA